MSKTVSELVSELGLEALALTEGERELKGGFTGDLLSYVMAHLRSDEAWITIMTNVNVIAVASLTDAACVIVADGAEVDTEVVQSAVQRGVNLLRSNASAFELCKGLAQIGL
ncbi:MAG: AraC family transcriptional regulator [Clostridia bacterium]|nr:AraC family transcriptional regulator [Clostridia bacterium]